jgi:hypothetical protein
MLYVMARGRGRSNRDEEPPFRGVPIGAATTVVDVIVAVVTASADY